LYNKDKTTLILAPAGISGMVTLPDGVTTISNVAFNRCTSLTGVIIPDSVTTIENFVFRSCSGIISITIPASVTTLGMDVFEHWTSSQVINVMFAYSTLKPSGWHENWDGYYNNAVVKYWNGTDWQ